MKKTKSKTPKGIVIIAVAALLVIAAAAVLIWFLTNKEPKVEKVKTEEEYVYFNPDESKAEADAGMKIDGVLDEEIYENKKWLYLTNDDGGNHVNIAMTSHFGEKGMYFVFDVTESVPIYVNLDRAPTLNSCIELYLAPSHVKSTSQNTVFEIDLLPTGDMSFKKSNGKYGYINVASSDDVMAYLGATTKGGEVNTPECYGYALELFIPWDYMEWLDQDVESMKNGYVLINPAHITSNNLTGTDHDLDRYWYYYVQQIGVDFTNVAQYFRFDGTGVQGTKEITLTEGEHFRYEGNNIALPGMNVPITIIPDEGYALTSILVDGVEQIHKVDFNEDGSVTIKVRCTGGDQTVSAAAEAVTAGNKTITGKVLVNNGTLQGVVLSYVGPQGERPVPITSDGKFELKDLAPGYYELKAEKEGYAAVSRYICLNRDIYTEVTLKSSVFTVTGGSAWILDDEGEGILYKIKGNGDIISNDSYTDFTFETYLRFDTELAKRGDDDYYLQQRSGIRILFSNGKYWHIDLMRENDQYVLQYGKITGNNSIFNWKNVHKLTDEQVAQYTGATGIKVTVKRVGNEAAIYLGDQVLFVEELDEAYKNYTAKVGMEAWIANDVMMRIPYSLTPSATIPSVPKPYFYASNTWDVEKQQEGFVRKTGVKGVDTWLDAAIIANDITTTARDLTPEANDYSMIYIFKFSNGEQFRVRLNHTDTDGKYRIQSMSGSTVYAAWQNRYTLTDEQAQKVQGDGIEYRVLVHGTTAYVYLDGQQVCTYDLSTVVATGEPSGIDKATVQLSVRMDGNYDHTVDVPFKLVQTDEYIAPQEPEDPDETVPFDPANQVTITVADMTNGKVTVAKEKYSIGQTVKLTIAPNAGYVQKLYIDGQPLLLDWNTMSYSFVAEKANYAITGEFVPALNAVSGDPSRWNYNNQAHGIISTHYPNDNDSWWTKIQGEYESISVIAKNDLPKADSYEGSANGWRMMIYMQLDNGNYYAFSLWNDASKEYAYNHFGGNVCSVPSTTGWGGNWRRISEQNAAAAEAINGDGAVFKLERIDGNHFQITINGTILETYTIPDVTAANKVVSVGFQHFGNRGKYVDVAYALTTPGAEPPVVEDTVELTIPTLEHGTVLADKSSYKVGDTITLTITPDADYAQKLTIDGQPLLLDWNTNSYSFVATKDSYVVAGEFVLALDAVSGDASRWNYNNQAHGVISTYYPNTGDSWWTKIQGEYKSISINAKNYLPKVDSYEGSANGWRVMLYMQLDNGKYYAFSVWNDSTKEYAYNHYGGNVAGVASVTGWGGNWRRISEQNAEAAAAINGDGAVFKLERTDGNHFQITINGTVLETYTIPDVTAANKVVSVGFQHFGNKGQRVDIPYALSKVGEVVSDDVELIIPTLEHGTVLADKSSYKVGDTITLTIAPDAGYVQKLYVDGQPLLLGWNTNSYSFVAEKATYEITGEYVPALNAVSGDASRWNYKNQAHGVITTYYPNDNDSWWTKIQGEFSSISINAKNYLPIAESYEGYAGGPWRMMIYMQLDNGKYYAFSVWLDSTRKYAYNHYGGNVSGVPSTTGWGGAWKSISDTNTSLADRINIDGVNFKLERIDGNHFQITLNDMVLETYTIPDVTAANKVVSVGFQHFGNEGQYVDIPFVLE